VIVTRLKRAVREWIGVRQWPKNEVPHAQSYEEQLYTAVVAAGDICFDVGANRGKVALFLSRLAGSSGKVVAFEPVWPVYTTLCHNLQLDTHLKAPIITVPLGLSDAERNAPIHVPGTAFGMGSMAPCREWSDAQCNARITSYPARFLTLDSFLASTSLPPPDFLKIDVEGAELLVLRGAAETFARGARPIMLIEVFAPWEEAFSYQPWELLSWLVERDYRLLFACPSGLIEYAPSPQAVFPPEYEEGYNVLAFVPEKHDNRVKQLNGLRVGGRTKRLPMAPPPRLNRYGGPAAAGGQALRVQP
jgi:FkbM family methyltransferase